MCLSKSLIGVVRFQAFLSLFSMKLALFVLHLCTSLRWITNHLGSFLLHYYWTPADSRNAAFHEFGFRTPSSVLALLLHLPGNKEHSPCLHWKVALLGNPRCCSFTDFWRKKPFSSSTHKTTKPAAKGWPLPFLFSVCIWGPVVSSGGDHSPITPARIIFSSLLKGPSQRVESEIWEVHLQFYRPSLNSLGWLYLLGAAKRVHTVYMHTQWKTGSIELRY